MSVSHKLSHSLEGVTGCIRLVLGLVALWGLPSCGTYPWDPGFNEQMEMQAEMGEYEPDYMPTFWAMQGHEIATERAAEEMGAVTDALLEDEIDAILEGEATGSNDLPIRAGCPQGCLSSQPGCDIKGNVSFETGEKIYHVLGQEFYVETVIDPTYGERWFCTEAEARANGWRRSFK